jgi:hypothetical protein
LRTAGILDIQTKTGMLDPGGNFTLYGGQQSTFQPSAEYGACQPEPVFQERSNQAGAAGLLAADGLTAMLLLRFSGSNTHASDSTSCIPSHPVSSRRLIMLRPQAASNNMVKTSTTIIGGSARYLRLCYEANL